MSEEIVYENANVRRHGNFRSDPTLVPGRCCANVPDGGRSPLFHQCGKKIKVHRLVREQDGSAKSWGFCSIHDPEAEEKRRNERNAAYEAQNEAWRRNFARQNKRPAEYADALRAIAAGHNDPRALAAEILTKWGDAQGIEAAAADETAQQAQP